MQSSVSGGGSALYSQAHYRAGAELCKALGHPSRLLVVHALSVGPLCVADLTARIGSDISTVSNHLAILRHAHIVTDERKGTQVFYRLTNHCITAVFECLTHFGVAPDQIASRESFVASSNPSTTSNTTSHENH